MVRTDFQVNFGQLFKQKKPAAISRLFQDLKKMKPHIDNHRPDPTYLRTLLKKAELSQRKAAHVLGVSERMMRYYLVHIDDPNYRPMPYAVQFCLECLAKT